MPAKTRTAAPAPKPCDCNEKFDALALMLEHWKQRIEKLERHVL